MKTKTRTEQKINLVDGMFTPSEASDIVQALIDQKINFHKIQRLSWREGQDDCDTHFPDCRINELMEEKKKIKAFIKKIRSNNSLVRIDGILNVTEVEI